MTENPAAEIFKPSGPACQRKVLLSNIRAKLKWIVKGTIFLFCSTLFHYVRVNIQQIIIHPPSWKSELRKEVSPFIDIEKFPSERNLSGNPAPEDILREGRSIDNIHNSFWFPKSKGPCLRSLVEGQSAILPFLHPDPILFASVGGDKEAFTQNDRLTKRGAVSWLWI